MICFTLSMGTQERAEHQLLLLCARRLQSPEQREQFRALLGGPIDWDYLLPRLFRNGLVPLFLHHVPEPALLPVPIFQKLRAEVIQGSLERLALLAKLQRVNSLLASHGIAVLAYKGPALAQLAYGSVKLRHFGDLDLLVAPRDRNRAIALLEVNGYQREEKVVLSPALQEKWENSTYEATLLLQNGTGAIDLHWAISAPHELLPLDFAEMWERRVAVEGMAGVESFGREDLLLCLCIHGVKHLWQRMEWIACVWSLIESGRAKPLNWNLLEQKMVDLGNRRILLLGLRLALELGLVALPAKRQDEVLALVPEHLLRALAADCTLKRLSRWAWRLCFTTTGAADIRLSWSLLLFSFGVRDGWRARLTYLLAALQSHLSPRPEDMIDMIDCPHQTRFTLVSYRRRMRMIIKRRLERLKKKLWSVRQEKQESQDLPN